MHAFVFSGVIITFFKLIICLNARRKKLNEKKTKKTTLDLIIPKYFLFLQQQEQIKGSQITKHDLDLIIHNPKSTRNNYFAI